MIYYMCYKDSLCYKDFNQTYVSYLFPWSCYHQVTPIKQLLSWPGFIPFLNANYYKTEPWQLSVLLTLGAPAGCVVSTPALETWGRWVSLSLQDRTFSGPAHADRSSQDGFDEVHYWITTLLPRRAPTSITPV